MAIKQATIRTLAQISDELDSAGYTAEADVIDQVTKNIVDEILEQEGQGRGRTVEAEMSGKASKALDSLNRALTSFLSKNLDSRGENRRSINKCIDLAEELQECIQSVMGNNNNNGA